MSQNNHLQIPDPNVIFPNEYKTSCFIKNVITAPNITVGDYTYYDDAVDPTGFEKNNVLFNILWSRSPPPLRRWDECS